MTLVLKVLIISFMGLGLNSSKNSTGNNRTFLTVESRINQGLEVRLEDIVEWTLQVNKYNVVEIHTLKEIYDQLELLSRSHYGHAKLQNLTVKRARARITAETAGGNHIPYLNISIGSYVQKPSIIVVAGIRGCDWLGVAAVMNLAQALVVDYELNRHYTNEVTWVLIPVLNPDGYNATLSNKNLRNWQKNMVKPDKSFVPLKQNSKNCFGVDLTKNFEYQWLNYKYEEASWCDKDYAGRKPFTENESKALRDTMQDNLDTIKIYVIIKQKRKAIMYPYRYSEIKPLFWEEFEYIAKSAAQAAYKQHKRLFEYGHVLEINGAKTKTAGDSDDWIKAHLGVSLAFTYEVAKENDNNKNISAKEIAWTNDEVFAALKVMAMKGSAFDEQAGSLPGIYSGNYKGMINEYILILMIIMFLKF